MEKELPINWKLTKVVDISEIVRGITYQKSDASTTIFDNSCLVLRGGNIQDGKIVIEDDCVYVPDSIVKKDQKLRIGDVIIVGSTGSAKLIGKAAFSLSDEDKISFGAFLIMLRPNKKIESRYFDYFFLTEFYRTEIRELAGGININNIRREHLEGIDFPLPPLQEQQRIVAKLDTLFGHLDALKTRLDRIPQLMKDFRQKVLTQAVTGKLTDDYNNFENWDFVSIDKLVGSIRTDIRTGPFGSSLNKAEHQLDGIPVWGIESISKKGEFTGHNKIFITKAKSRELKSFEVLGGDIIISRSGTVGELCLLPNDISFGIISTNLMKISLNKKVINPTFFCYQFKGSQELLDKLQELCSGSTRLFLTQSILKKLLFVLPHLEEQQEIVRRVESLFVKADQIEASYQKLKAKIEALPQALLAKAFRGELVAQLPTDGDVRDLLEQIKRAKEGLGKGGKSKKLKTEDEVRMVAAAGARFGKK